jgi:hypothetical protein
MATLTDRCRQRSPVLSRPAGKPKVATRTVEIQLPIENLRSRRTLCRISILPIDTHVAEPHEEPTWEDAEWQ